MDITRGLTAHRKYAFLWWMLLGVDRFYRVGEGVGGKGMLLNRPPEICGKYPAYLCPPFAPLEYGPSEHAHDFSFFFVALWTAHRELESILDMWMPKGNGREGKGRGS